ncbi:MAG: MFS transporter [Bacillota bacterium]|nr:MFS transporter [Bacillota bacterium]
MEQQHSSHYMRGFIPYGAAAFLVGIVGGFTTVLSPAFVQDIGIAYNNTTWTALAMAISTATFAPILGKLGDMIGRRVTLLLGIAVFTLGNILTAVAQNLPFMLAARFVVGIGAAAIAPVIMAYIVTAFPPDAMAKGFSLYMLIASGAVIFGPTLGGLMLQAAGWRSMMWVCVGISVLIFVLCLFTCDKTPFERKSLAGFDSLGSVFIVLFFSFILCIPSFGQNFGWASPAFWTVLVAAALSLWLLVLVEKRAENPILQGSFLARKAFVLPILALFLTQGLMQANMTNIIVFVNYTQPENTLISSYAISIMYLGMSLGAVILGPLADHREPKDILTGSLILTGIGCGAMLLFSAHSSAVLLAGALGVLGFGLGGNGTIFMKVVLSGLSPQAAGAGTGTYGLFRDLSAPFGVAVFVPMFTNGITARIAAGTTAGLSEVAAAASAAVHSIRVLALTELACVALGIVVVRLIPRIHPRAAAE